MNLGLENKVALVTGSTKGIGKAIAIELAREKANVIVNGRNKGDVESVVSLLKTSFPDTQPKGLVMDIGNPDDRKMLFKEIFDVDILVNNIGIFEPMNYFDIDDEIWNKFFNVNVLGANNLCKFYLKKMLEKNFGRIIFIASEEAIMPSGQMPQYSMTKTMNLSLAKSLSKLTIGTDVTVNTIMPGPTLTEGVEQMLKNMYENTNIPPEKWETDFMKNYRSLSQIQKLIRPEEIGRFVAFVASPYAKSFSGTALRLDGGMVPTIY